MRSFLYHVFHTAGGFLVMFTSKVANMCLMFCLVLIIFC